LCAGREWASGGRRKCGQQTAWDARKNIVGGDSVLEQARQAFRNLATAMEAAGGTLKDVVALRIYVVDYQAESGTAVGIALRECFSPENPPASTWIGVSALAVPEFLIESKRQRCWTESLHRKFP
jgi:2-iminobutanoate/2-iminopropanoate deaminase